MSVTIQNLIDLVDRHTGDASTDRISQVNRYDAITEAVIWLQENHKSELQDFSYRLSYLDGVNYYNVTTILADLLMASDMRRINGMQDQVWQYKSGADLAVDIAMKSHENGYGIERVNGKSYIVINHTSQYTAQYISHMDTLTDGGGTWSSDTSTSDAGTLSASTTNFNEGYGSLTYNVIVAQSGNNRSTISNSTLTSQDFTSLLGISSGLVDVYIPDVTYISSVTIYWGSSSSNYYSAIATTDIMGNAFVNGWNTVKVDWTSSTTVTGTPDVTAITYARLDLNYSASQANMSGVCFDNFRFARPEFLDLYYLSWNVGKTTGGTNIQSFSATTDKPYYSGQYDQLKFATSHYAASILLHDLRLHDDAEKHEELASKKLVSAIKMIPSSVEVETKTFRPAGVNFNRRARRTNNR